MEFYPFPAELSSSYIQANIFGNATVSAEDNSLQFTGEYIPLLPMGQTASICWITGTEVMATFTGTVYLSSPGLVRLVDVNAELIRAARAIFASNVRFPATVYPAAAQPETASASPGLPGEMLYLSKQNITLLARGNVAEGESITLSLEVDFLTLHHLPLLVERRLPLKQGETLLLCRVLPTDDANIIALSAYTARLQRQGNI